MDAPEDDLAERDLAAVLQRLVRILRLRRGVDADGEVVLEREPPMTRDVVGVRVGLDRPNEANPAPLGFLEVLLDRERRIDDDCLARALVADEVRSAAESVVDELREDHQPRRELALALSSALSFS